MQTKLPTNRGFTLVETIIYLFGVILLLSAIVTFMFYMYRWYEDATVVPRVDQAGTTLIDRIVRDVRSGSTVNVSGSSFGTQLGSLSLTSSPNGTLVTKQFAVSGGRATYAENGGAAAYLTPVGMTVTKLMFTEIDASTISKSIRIDGEITYTTRKGTFTRSYSGLAVMRNSYQ